MKTPRILVVDENVEIAQLEEAMFRLHNYNVEVTGHAEEALRRLATRQYNVIVIGAPLTVAGRFMLDILREEFGSVLSCTIVATWLTGDAALMQRCRRAGVYAVIAKPFDVEELSSVVTACIANACQPAETRWIGMPPAIAEKSDSAGGA